MLLKPEFATLRGRRLCLEGNKIIAGVLGPPGRLPKDYFRVWNVGTVESAFPGAVLRETSVDYTKPK